MGEKVERSKPDLPDELTGPIPWKALLSDNALRGAILLPLGSVVVLLAAIQIGRSEIPELRSRIELRGDTRLAVAQITSLHSGGRGVEIVEYSFNGPGKEASGSAKVPYYLFETMRESRQIIVRYRPSDPSINHPEAWEWSLGAEGFFGLFALLCFIVGGTCSIAYPIQLLRLRKLILCGHPATANIQSSTRDGRVFSYQFTFQAEDGIEVTGKDSTRRELAVGAATWVLFLPENPRRNCLYPSAEFEVYS